MHSFRRPLTTALALVLSVSSLLAEEALSLKPQWQAGKRYFQTTRMEQAVTLSFGPATMEQKSDTTMETSMAVTRHEDGKRKRIGFKYERIALKADMSGQKMTIDTAKPEEAAASPLGNPFAGMTGKEIRAVTDANDKVVEIENAAEVLPKSGNPMMGAMFQKDAIIQSINQGNLLALPGKPIKAGDSWPFAVEMPVPGLGAFSIKGTYTFKGMAAHGGAPCAELAMDGVVGMAAAPAGPGAATNPLAMLGMKVESGTTKGTVWFDNVLGAARGSDMTQVMSMSTQDPTNPAQSIKIPITQHVTTELTKVEDLK